MRACLAIVLAAILVWLTAPAADAASKSGQQGRSLGECVQLANDRGWNRRGEKGRWPFIKACMQGRVG